MKKIMTAVTMAGVLVFGGAASCDSPPADESPGIEFSFEDCDAEDWKNYDSECGRKSPRPMLTARQPAPGKTATVKAPEPRRTTKRR